MIAYIFFKESKIIICKINNVNSIDIIGKEINGDSTIRFGDSQDFIILQSDTTNLNIGDIIDLMELEDERTYFTSGKEIWLQEKLQKANEQNKELTNTITSLNNDMNTALLGIADVYEFILGGM